MVAQVRLRNEPTPVRRGGAPDKSLSIVVPLHNEADGLARFHRNLEGIAGLLGEKCELRTEVIYIDDGSKDATLAVARALPAAVLDVEVGEGVPELGKLA